MIPLFVDASALIALHYPQDSCHKRALAILENISLKQFTSYMSVNILIESLTIISQRVSKRYAIELLDELRSGEYLIINPDQDLISQAEDIFRTVKSKNVSYSDCISIAVMRRYGIEWLFSFDIHFKKQGFRRFGIDK